MSKYIEEDFQHNKTHHFVPKGWGYELWITNNHRYCGKLLKIIKGKKLSWHYHVIKDEVMFCQSGEVKITYGWDNDISRAQEVFLKKGESFHIPRKLVHRIEAIEDSEIFEFSTQHFDEDSYRVEKGD
jgi:mannose-6-phosphate isomerase-like protein (cupin superfamily)